MDEIYLFGTKVSNKSATVKILKVTSESVFWKLRESEQTFGTSKTVESPTRKNFNEKL